MKKIVALISIAMLFGVYGTASAGSYGPDGTIWENWKGSPSDAPGVMVYSTKAEPYAMNISVDPSKRKSVGQNLYSYKALVVGGTSVVLVRVVVNCNSGRYKILMPVSGGIDSQGNDRNPKTHDFG